MGGECINQEFSAAALIPQGPYRGWVLMWHLEYGADCAYSDTTSVFLLDPSNPQTIYKIGAAALTSNIFCSGFSWDRDGDLIVAGGQPYGFYNRPPKKTYRFRPSVLDYPPISGPPGSGEITGNPWKSTGDMSITRYYPTLITLCNGAISVNLDSGSPMPAPYSPIPGGSSFVCGGWPDPNNNNDRTNEFFQLLPPTTSVWSQTLQPDGGANTHSPSVLSITTFETYWRQTLSGALPSVMFSLYPFALQLSDVQSGATQVFARNIFIAADLRDGTEGPLTTNPGDSWLVRPPYANSLPSLTRWEIWRGPSASPTQNPSSHDRVYGSPVLLHTLRPNLLGGSNGLNRVLGFGGISNNQTIPAVVPNWQITTATQEYAPGNNPAGTPAGGSGGGRWVTKTLGINTPRYYNNAVILPTGEILIAGGATNIASNGSGGITYMPGASGFYNPGPELYEPGDAGGPGGDSRAQMAQAPPWNGIAGAPPYPRNYHGLALLLPDGRVLTVGGGWAGPSPISADPDSRFTGEIFSPPYLGNVPRPVIDGIYDSNGRTENVPLGTTFKILVTHTHPYPIERLVLIRPAAVTHDFDMSQRYIELDFISDVWDPQDPEETLLVTAPSEDLGPPGYYMLFAVENQGGVQRSPSVARFIRFY